MQRLGSIIKATSSMVGAMNEIGWLVFNPVKKNFEMEKFYKGHRMKFSELSI